MKRKSWYARLRLARGGGEIGSLGRLGRMSQMLDNVMQCAPQDETSVDIRIALVQGQMTLDEAIQQHGLDLILRVLGMDK